MQYFVPNLTERQVNVPISFLGNFKNPFHKLAFKKEIFQISFFLERVI